MVVQRQAQNDMLQSEFDGIGVGSRQRWRDGEAQRDGHRSDAALLELGQPGQLRIAAPCWKKKARFGNGDGTYTLAEQTNALMRSTARSLERSSFYGQPRHIRLGVGLNF